MGVPVVAGGPRDESTDREAFGELVREALEQLHDRTFLQKHPLRALLGGATGDRGATVLQQSLLDAIEQLQPGPATPSDSPAWRRYLYLRRRYVEGATLEHIRDELATGERQARRYNHEALDALTALLWSRYSLGQLHEDRPGQPSGSWDDGTALAAELARMVRFVPPGPTPLPETLASATETVARLLESKRLALEVSLPSYLPPVAVPRVILRQILLGLLVSCVEQYPGARVRVLARPSSDTLELRLAIRRGRTALRGPTLTRDPIAASAPEHSALAMARHLIELQQGSLVVQPSSSGDAEIRITLPLSPQATVLVIDDNLDFRRLFQRYLEGSSYRAIFAEVTDDVPRMTREKRPDIITLDIMMPMQDGWEVLQALKNQPETRDIPVIVCSVLQLPTLARSLGVAEHLAKPITHHDLLTALGRCRSRQALEAASQGSAEGTP